MNQVRLGRQAVLGVPEPSIWASAAGAHPRRLEQSVVNGNGCIPGTKVYAGISGEVQVSPKLVNCGGCRNSGIMAAACLSDAVKGPYARGILKCQLACDRLVEKHVAWATSYPDTVAFEREATPCRAQ